MATASWPDWPLNFRPSTQTLSVDAARGSAELQGMADLQLERGPEAALRAMQRRFDAANLRVQIAAAEHRLDELKTFEKDFGDLMGQLRPSIQACVGAKWPPEDPWMRPKILAADMLRLDLRSRL